MKVRSLLPVFISLLAVAACGEDNKKKAAGSGDSLGQAGVKSAGSAAKIETLKLDIPEMDEIWSLAPEGTLMGVVATPGTAARLHSMMMGVFETAEQRPLGAQIVRGLREKAQNALVDLSDPASLAKSGIDPREPAALFMVAKERVYLMLPVANRDAFRKMLGATTETVEGIEVDRLPGNLVCTNKDDRYLCASKASMLKNFGGVSNSELAKQVASLPPKYRGHVEFAMDVDGIARAEGDLDATFGGQFSKPRLGVISLRLGHGAITARLRFQVTPLADAAAAVSVASGLTKSVAKDQPSGLFTMRLPIKLLTDSLQIEEGEIAGLALKKDVLSNVTGEIVGYTGQSDELWGRFSLGLVDSTPFKTLVNVGCGLVPAAGIPGVTVTPGDGKCEAMIDVSKLSTADPTVAAMFDQPVAVGVEVKSDRLDFTLGKAAPPEMHEMGPLGQELTSDAWNFVVWAEGIAIANGSQISWHHMPKAIPENLVEEIRLSAWMLAHVYELGFAGAVRADGIHGIVHIASYAADPPDAYDAYQKAVAKALDSGGAAKDFAEIKNKWPTTMSGRGASGAASVVVAMIAGMIAAVAIPAFNEYQQNSLEASGPIHEAR